jgi:hypothetical protein
VIGWQPRKLRDPARVVQKGPRHPLRNSRARSCATEVMAAPARLLRSSLSRRADLPPADSPPPGKQVIGSRASSPHRPPEKPANRPGSGIESAVHWCRRRRVP